MTAFVVARSRSARLDRSFSTLSYKHTLKLPCADLPHGDYSDAYHWQNLYEWQRQRKDAPAFVLHDGPPFANGELHMGHMLNKTVKDIVVRYKIMKGYRVDYRPGWDCHGLPIEAKVKSRKLEPIGIRRACRDLAANVMLQHKQVMQSWSMLADYQNAYCTMSKSYEAKQIEIFGEMAFRGLLRRERRPVHWSPSSRTALAEAELDYRDDHCSKAVYVAFPVSNRPGPMAELLSNTSALIWTTTPWTLEANTAIAFSIDSKYAIIQTIRGRFLVAEARVDALRQIFPNLAIVSTGIKGSELSNIEVQHPYDQHRLSVPLVSSEYVTDSAGTGLVHTAGGHGKEDFAVSRQHDLPVLCPVDEEGKFTSEAADRLAGLYVLGAGQEVILQMLVERGALIHQEDFIHAYPYDWRTKQPIIQRATPQWFCRLDGPVREAALEALADVNMIPDGGQRLRAMLTARDDWCISRQRVWGLPIPVFYHRETGDPLLEPDTISHVRDMIARYGSDCWWEQPVANLLPESRRQQADVFVPGLDTLDVWFDSGSSWAAVLNGVPADLVVEGSDQHRGWFQSLLLTRIAAGGKRSPYKSVVTHGFVMDESSRKMSKSVGNVISPTQLLNDPRYSLETLRMWVASSDFSCDVNIGPVNLSKANECLRRIRNAARFLLGCTADLSACDQLSYSSLLPIDRYALHVLSSTCREVNEAFDAYQFAKVLSALNKFLGGFFSPIYANACKDRLYADAESSVRRRSAQTVFSLILSSLTRLVAPIAPHSAEDIFKQTNQCLYAKKTSIHSVFAHGWVDIQSQWSDDSLAKDWSVLLQLREIVNKMLEQIRDDKQIGNSLQASVALTVSGSSPFAAIIMKTGEDNVAELLSVSQFALLPLLGTPPSSFLRKTLSTKELCGNAVEEMTIHISPAHGSKCARCWRYTVYAASANLCDRCHDVLKPEPVTSTQSNSLNV